MAMVTILVVVDSHILYEFSVRRNGIGMIMGSLVCINHSCLQTLSIITQFLCTLPVYAYSMLHTFFSMETVLFRESNNCGKAPRLQSRYHMSLEFHTKLEY